MKELIANILGGSAMVVLLVLLMILSPMLMLWSINTLSEISGSTLYIPHELWSYVATFAIIVILRGNSSSK